MFEYGKCAHNRHINNDTVFYIPMPTTLQSDLAIQGISPRDSQFEIYDSLFTFGGSFGLRVNPSGSKVFFLIYSINGKRRRMSLGRFPVLSLEEAKKQALSILKQVQNGRDPSREKEFIRVSSFGELLEDYLQSDEFKRVSLKTKSEYQRLIDRELRSRFSERLLSSFSEYDFSALLKFLTEQRGTPVLANRVRSILSRLFSYGLKNHYLEKNPVKAVSRNAEKRERRNILTLKELQSIWAVLSEEDPYVRVYYRLLMLTAQRPEVLLRMSFSDVSLDRWNIRVQKSGEISHMIPLTMHAAMILQELPYRQGLLFSKDGLKPLYNLRKVSGRIAKVASIHQFSPLDIRRSVEVRMRELGTRPDIIEKLFGRATVPARFKEYYQKFDYFEEMRKSLLIWADVLIPTGLPKNTKGAKVIRLFGQ